MKRLGNRLLVLVLLLFPGSFQASSVASSSNALQESQGSYKRLILKDESFESISQYQIQGDRVRYFSSERHAWEELPYSWIDWAATEKYAAQASREVSERTSEALDRAARERSEEEARTPLIAPGVRLPSPDGVFLLNEYLKKTELNRLVQNGADLKKNTGSNILRGVVNPVAGSKQTVELKGLHARIQSHVQAPAIYFPIDTSDPMMVYNSETARDHLRIVRCGNKKGNRIVATISIAIYGKVKQKAQFVEAKIEPVSAYWVKVTPVAPLQTGEYALVELAEKGSMNQFVWDFGVNPAAPPNPAVETSGSEKSEPVLIEKPQRKAKH